MDETNGRKAAIKRGTSQVSKVGHVSTRARRSLPCHQTDSRAQLRTCLSFPSEKYSDETIAIVRPKRHILTCFPRLQLDYLLPTSTCVMSGGAEKDEIILLLTDVVHLNLPGLLATIACCVYKWRRAALKSRSCGDIFLLFLFFFFLLLRRRLRFGGRRQERASGRASERRRSALGRLGFSFCPRVLRRPSRPSLGFYFAPRFGITPRFFPRTLLSSSHRPGQSQNSAFGCYLRNFWRAVARYFLSAQSQAVHCCWFLAVSGCCCCFLPPSLPLGPQPPARKRSLRPRR